MNATGADADRFFDRWARESELRGKISGGTGAAIEVDPLLIPEVFARALGVRPRPWWKRLLRIGRPYTHTFSRGA